jgi:arabinogalactan oligomer/maltooligosaccharide transport system substrate-binding protein
MEEREGNILVIKRFAASIMALTLAGTVLAGCAKPASNPTAPQAGTKDQPAKQVEVVFWEQEDNVEKVFDPLIAKFQEQNKNIKITRVHYTTEDLRQNFLQAVAGNQGPNVIYGPDDNVGVFSTAGVIQPLDSFFDSGFLDQFVPSTLDNNRLTGKLWGIPDRSGNHLTLVVNKKLVPNIPQNTDELLKFGQDFAKANPGKYGLVFNQDEPFWAAPWLGGFGGKVFNDKGEPTLDTPEMVAMMTYIADLKAKGVIPKESNYDTAEAIFKEGKAAMIINGPWSWNGYKDAGIDIQLARIPQVTGKNWPAPFTSTKSYQVSKLTTDAAVKEATKKFIQFMTSEETQKTLVSFHKQHPTNKKALESDVVKNDPMLKDSAAQLAVGTPMPIVPEMRHIWDAWKPQWQLVLSGGTKPADAAKAAQADAVKRIKENK